ncbi:MAG: hypothetical protein ISR72_07180 [Methylobacter sp.]|nr:hypothetical protein [Methylobacter sp.]
MALLKKLVIASFISTAMLAAAPTAMAKPQGKIENQSQEGVLEAFDESIAAAEAALEALNSGAKEDAVLDLMKEAKQALNRIESATVNREKERANALLKHSRSALKKGDVEESKTLMIETVEKFKSLKQMFLSF